MSGMSVKGDDKKDAKPALPENVYDRDVVNQLQAKATMTPKFGPEGDVLHYVVTVYEGESNYDAALRTLKKDYPSFYANSKGLLRIDLPN